MGCGRSGERRPLYNIMGKIIYKRKDDLILNKRRKVKRAFERGIRENYQLYILLLPAITATVVFCYLPIYGIQLAFREYRIGQSITSGAFVGLRYFTRFFNNAWCLPVIRNTVILSALTRIIEWPAPIILALLLHNCFSRKIRKFSQSATYIPYLISTVVVVSMMKILLARDTGIANILIRNFGGTEIDFFGLENLVFPMYVISEIWQGAGYGAVIYLAALSAIDPQLSEAAITDGATKLQRIFHIDIPCIEPTIITMLILRCGRMFQMGPDKILLMQTPLNLGASEIISTYIYKTGIVDMQYGFSTAIGLLNNAINFLILIGINQLSKKYTDTYII